VSSSGVVKGIAPGTATITATVSSKKYTCKVTVKEVFNSKKAIESLSATDYKVKNGIIQIVKNNYSFPMILDAKCVFYDEDNLMIGVAPASILNFEKGKEAVLIFYAPTDSNYNPIPYDHYKIIYSAESTDAISNIKDIKISSNKGTFSILLEVINDGDLSSEFTQIGILFYKDGEIIDYSYRYADVNEPGSVDYLEFYFPYENNKYIEIDDYAIYVNYSYGYNK